MTTEAGKAALAAALHIRYNHAAAPETGCIPHSHRIADHHIADAAAILAAMPDWRLVPADAVPVDAYPRGYDHRPGCSRTHPVTGPCAALAPAPSEP